MRIPRLLNRDDMGLPRSHETEWLDAPGCSQAVLEDNFRDMARINTWLGGSFLTIRALEGVCARLAPGAPLSILDIGTGAADIPRAIARWAVRKRRRVHITALDRSPDVLEAARAIGPPCPALTLALGDVRKLPYAARSFDVVMSSMVLHHLEPDDAISLYTTAGRIARWAVIVNDLVRNRPSYEVARLLIPRMTDNSLTRHDAPLSIRRAYTCREMLELARAAGLQPVALHHVLYYRVALTLRSSIS